MGSLLVQKGGTVYLAFIWYISFSISLTVTLISQWRVRFYIELVIKGLVNENRPKNPYGVLEVTWVNVKKDLLVLRIEYSISSGAIN